MFCPTCKSELHEHSLLDPALNGSACENGHIFYSTPNEQFGGIPTADTVRPRSQSGSDLEVLKFWLTDKHARKTMPNQFAVVCRRIAEIIEHNHHVAREDRPFKFCHLCGSALQWFESGDLYMEGMRCGNGHEVFERGRTIYFKEDGARANLSAEMTDDDLPQLLQAWLSGSEWARPYLHPQLREVLERFKFDK